MADWQGGWTCCVEQGHYGHMARKATWLLAVGCELPSLLWGDSGKLGKIESIGGKDKTKIRNATPLPFRDLLISMAMTVKTAGADGNKSLLADSGKPQQSV